MHTLNCFVCRGLHIYPSPVAVFITVLLRLISTDWGKIKLHCRKRSSLGGEKKAHFSQNKNSHPFGFGFTFPPLIKQAQWQTGSKIWWKYKFINASEKWDAKGLIFMASSSWAQEVNGGGRGAMGCSLKLQRLVNSRKMTHPFFCVCVCAFFVFSKSLFSTCVWWMKIVVKP